MNYSLLLAFCFLLLLGCSTNSDEDGAFLEQEVKKEANDLKDGKSLENSKLEDDEFLNSSGGSDEAFLNGKGLGEADLKKELGAGVETPPKPITSKYPESSLPQMPKIPAPQRPTTGPPPVGAGSGAITSEESYPNISDFEDLNLNETTLPQEDLGEPAPLLADTGEVTPSQEVSQAVVPLAKIQRNAYFDRETKKLMNTVYIVRPDDKDIVEISKKLLGTDKSKEIIASNKHLNGRADVGDKIYYNSPNRPQDTSELLTYYEDSKIDPQYYVTKKDETIRGVGQKLLGFDEAWKELYAINDSVKAQGALPAGLKIRYWSGDKVEASVPPPEEMKPLAIEAPEIISQESNDEAVPEEVPFEEPSLPEVNIPPTSSPGAVPVAPVPLPPTDIEVMPPNAAAKNKQEGSSSPSLFMILGGALIAIGIAVLVAIQIKNRKKKGEEEIPPSLEYTQV